MVRRLLVIALAICVAPLAGAASRYVAEREGAAVKWSAWGSAAIERARKTNRPIFLSIGFASSWDVHRMHRDAFADDEVARLLNAHYVPVLLDRIVHPEIAEAYETVLRSMTGAAGWPASLILTPTLEPFAGSGFADATTLRRLLVLNANRWADDREGAIAEGRENIDAARALAEKRIPSEIDAATIEGAVDSIAATYDPEHSGFGETPRRPAPMTVSFLLRYAARTKNENIRAAAVETLRRIAAKPLRDQLGGGFHRATHDAAWTAPHFEKMLPDQALLAMVYLQAYAGGGDAAFLHVARTTLDYASRDLMQPGGAFNAAQDAHSIVPRDGGPRVENGAFYFWTREEITHLLGTDGAAKVLRIYEIPQDELALPLLSDPRWVVPPEDAVPLLEKLLSVRQVRPAPFRDPTIVAGWNGLMISALARAFIAFDDRAYRDAAVRAALVLESKLWNAQKKTLRRTDAASGSAEALAEDYAFLISGLLDLFKVTYDVRWFDLANALQERQDALFWDASAGRYTTGHTLPAPLRGLLSENDDETPAVNSIAATNLQRLAALTGKSEWAARPEMMFQSFGGRIRTDGARLAQLATAYELSLRRPETVVVVGDPRKQDTWDLLAQAHGEIWDPLLSVVLLPMKGRERERVVRALPFTGGLEVGEAGALAYICAAGECRRQ